MKDGICTACTKRTKVYLVSRKVPRVELCEHCLGRDPEELIKDIYDGHLTMEEREILVKELSRPAHGAS